MIRPVILISFLFVTLASAYGQWTLQESHTTADLRGIHSVGNGVAWASGNGGTVLRTINDGKEWQRCATPQDADLLDFRSIQAFDASTAVVMSSGKGPLSRLYKTTDACQSWKLLFTNPDREGFWDAIQFYAGKTFDAVPGSKNGMLTPVSSRTNGMLIGDPVGGAFAIFFTNDGGDTWHRWGDEPGTRLVKARQGESLFAASNSSIASPGINGQYCFVTGGKGGSRLIYEQGHSPFDMSSWSGFSSLTLPFASSDSAGAFSISRRDEPDGTSGHFVIVGGDYLKPEVGAAAYAYQPSFLIRVSAKSAQTPPHGYRSAVAYDLTSKTWIAVGPNGTDISTDDGQNWHALLPSTVLNESTDADQHWNAVSLPFVVGPHGRIGKLKPTALAP